MITCIQDIQALAISGFTDWQSLGSVNVKEHGDLLLFSYSRAVRDWNFFELVSRGLIIHRRTGEIIALPFPKFFNWGESGYTASPIKTTTEKMDGSLGILYRRGDGYAIATRGSFTSDQAFWATRHLNEHYNLRNLDNNLTLLFEIIYPGNRVVVDYGSEEKLVLIGARNRFTGEYTNINPIASWFGFSLPKTYAFRGVEEIIQTTRHLDGNHEGYVVEFEDGQRLKFKGDRYVEIHRAISNLSFKSVLISLRNGTIENLLAALPEEFSEVVDDWITDIELEILKVLREVRLAFREAPKTIRKEFALWVLANHKPLSKYLFIKYNGGDVVRAILKTHDFNEGESDGL